MPQFRYLDPCSSTSQDPVSILPAWSPPDTGIEDVPRPRSVDSGGDFRNFFDVLTVQDLEAGAAAGGGIRTLYGSGNPPPPAAPAGSGGGGSGGGPELMLALGVGLLVAAVNRVLNKENGNGAAALALAAAGGGLVYLSRGRAA